MKYGKIMILFMVFLLTACQDTQSNEAPLFYGVDVYYIPQGYQFDDYHTLVSLSDKEDGNIEITKDMINTRNVDVDHVGIYPVYYIYKDLDGNKTVYKLMLHVITKEDYFESIVSGELDITFDDNDECALTLFDLLNQEIEDYDSVSGKDFYELYMDVQLSSIKNNEGFDHIEANIYTTSSGNSLLIVTYEVNGSIKVYDAITVYDHLTKAVDSFDQDEHLVLSTISDPLTPTEIDENEYLKESNITQQTIQAQIDELGINPDFVYVYETSWQYNHYTWEDCSLVFEVDGFYLMVYWY